MIFWNIYHELFTLPHQNSWVIALSYSNFAKFQNDNALTLSYYIVIFIFWKSSEWQCANSWVITLSFWKSKMSSEWQRVNSFYLLTRQFLDHHVWPWSTPPISPSNNPNQFRVSISFKILHNTNFKRKYLKTTKSELSHCHSEVFMYEKLYLYLLVEYKWLHMLKKLQIKY